MIKKSQLHLEKADERYFQHISIALKVSFEMLTGALMAFTHAFFPSFFTNSASNKIKKLYHFIQDRK